MKSNPVLPGLFMLQIQELTPPKFDGATYSPAKDQARLGAQLRRVLTLLHNYHEKWFTLREISDATGDPEASVSARLRDLRKKRNGGYEVEHRRRHGAGLWEYKLKDV